MKKAQEIAQRILALFLSSALAIVGGSAIIAPELELWTTNKSRDRRRVRS